MNAPEPRWPATEIAPRHFIANRFVPASDGRTLPMIDPSDGAPFAAIARGNAADVDVAVKAARQARGDAWGRLAPAERGRRLAALSRAIGDHADALALIEARDCGKPLAQARADVTACARYFEFYAGAPDKLHGTTIPYAEGYAVLTWREAHGVTGHVIPWNYPLQIFGRSVGAALAAGNACVVKPAEDACLSLLRVAELAAASGLPEGALNVVTGLGAEAGVALVAHPAIAHVSFTGSPATGAEVAAAAARRHCPVTLELGGKSPQIVFADADLDAAVPAIVNAIVQNAGQTCSAGSRLLVECAIYEPLLERLADRFHGLVAAPALADRDCGPLIRASQLARVRGFLDDAKRSGLAIVASGRIADDAPANGYYVAPTLLRDVPREHRLACDEVFGPVLAAMAFDDEAHAVALANATDYGLVAGVWTRDGGRQLRMARAVQSGQVFVNNYGAGGGVELPFGGVKHSGHGREKGFEALYAFTTVKTVVLRHG
ncbi:MAG TPA: aldehyde dehydrogenase family protein [Casimicrobiaceae bacterium]|jgi:aldehyde dehydrogenase (NAD+)|nr:aldehyde dehydrogenase family protein [Casimicrobiaceae bacterium]